MKLRNAKVLTALVAAGALALSGVGTATASNGADDPAGHVSGGHGADDASPAPGTATTPTVDDNGGQRKNGKKHRGRNHREDGPRHHGGHGADDGPNHT
jgi:hypothetical protein